MYWHAWVWTTLTNTFKAVVIYKLSNILDTHTLKKMSDWCHVFTCDSIEKVWIRNCINKKVLWVFLSSWKREQVEMCKRSHSSLTDLKKQWHSRKLCNYSFNCAKRWCRCNPRFIGICIYDACPWGGSKTSRRCVKEQQVLQVSLFSFLFPSKETHAPFFILMRTETKPWQYDTQQH